MKNRISRVPSGLIEKKAVLPESSDDRDPLSHDRAVAGRRRGAGVRAWLRIDEEGNTEVLHFLIKMLAFLTDFLSKGNGGR